MTHGHSIVVNAFRPGASLDDPARFAGRRQQVSELTDALQTIGTCPVIYGDRGLGKTSLALQLQHIAKGESELLKSLNLGHRAISREARYDSYFATCTKSTHNLTGLLQLMTSKVEHSPKTGRERRRSNDLAAHTTTRTVDLKVLHIEEGRTYVPHSYDPPDPDIDVSERFEYVTRRVTSSTGRPMLFIIDELDQLVDTDGVAGFIKAASSQSIKFLLVGIASSVSDLIADHASLDRSILPVHVPPMNNSELLEIVAKANRYLLANKISIVIDDSAASALVELSTGFPWFVHVIGESALKLAYEAHKTAVDDQDVAQAVKDITSNRFAQQFSDMYQRAVRDSYQRELVLRALAEWRGSDIPTNEVYGVLRDHLRVKRPSEYKRHLSTEDFGRVVIVPSFQRRGLVRFANEMFKVYVRTRDSIYEGLDARVKAAFADYRSDDI